MITLASTAPTTIIWAAVVERAEPAADGHPGAYGPMHAARRNSPTTACGQPLNASRRRLAQVTFSSITDAASSMVCSDCRRAVQRDPEGLLD